MQSERAKKLDTCPCLRACVGDLRSDASTLFVLPVDAPVLQVICILNIVANHEAARCIVHGRALTQTIAETQSETDKLSSDAVVRNHGLSYQARSCL